MENICKLTAAEIRKLYDEKKATVCEVTKAFLDNIKEKDGDIKAYITVCEEEAMERAREVQKRFDNGEKLRSFSWNSDCYKR